MHTGTCQHGDRGHRVVHWCGAAGIHGVRQARIAHIQVVPVVTRGGHGQVLQLDHPVHCAVSGLGGFERYGPGRTAGLAAHCAQFAIERHQRMRRPVLL